MRAIPYRETGSSGIANRTVVVAAHGALDLGGRCRLDPPAAPILHFVSNLIDSGWAAWLPFELIDALEARHGNAAQRRALRTRLERGPSPEDRERWERFALVCPSRIDLPQEDRLDADAAYAVLDDLGPARRRAGGGRAGADARPRGRARAGADPLGARHRGGRRRRGRHAELGNVLGGGKTGRNDPCPCGSGKKFKRCHGR